MKKVAVFFVLLLILANALWGQAEFTWTGNAGNNDWETPGNWTVTGGTPNPAYPGGGGRNNDSVIITNNIWSPGIQLSNDITIKNFTIQSGQVYININGHNLTVTDQTVLGGLIFVRPPGTTTSSSMNITNLTVASGNAVGISDGANISNVRMNGALVTMDPYYTNGAITLDPVTGDIGNITAGNRPVIVNIPDGAGPLSIGDIDSAKNITVNAGVGSNVDIGDISSDGNVTINAGAGSNVDIGDISSEGNVTINAGTGSNVDISDIEAGGTVSIPGGGNVVIEKPGTNNFIWNGSVSSDWTDNDNWEDNNAPGNGSSSSRITIHSGGHSPIFSGATLTCDTLLIQTGASLDMGAYNLTVKTLTNNGNLILTGNAGQSVSITPPAPVNGTVTYTAGGTNFAGLTSFNNLTIKDGNRTVGTITVSEDFRLEDGSLSATSVTVSGTSFIAENVTTTAAQTYTGAVTLGGTGTLITLAGATVTLGHITGGGKSLTITGNGVLNGGSGINALTVSGTNGNFTLHNNPLSSATVNITGTSSIAENITTTGANPVSTPTYAQYYGGAVTLGDDVTFTGIAGSTVYFNSTVNGTTSARDLTVATANAVFNGAVTTLIKDILVNGTSDINANITTTGTQTYTGAVTLGGTGTRTLIGTTVTLGQFTGPGTGLSLTITGNGVLNGGSGIGALSVSGNFTLNNNPLSSTTVNVTGTSNINADITTTGTQTYTGAVTLGGTGPRTLTGTTVTLGQFTGPGTGLSLTITGNGVLNGGSGINNLSVSGTATINQDITTTGTQTYTGAVTLGGTGALRTLTGTTVTLGQIITGNTNSLTIAGNGILDGGSGIGALSVSGNFTLNNNPLSSTTVNVTGTSAIEANISTTGNQSYTGAVTLTGTRTLTASGGSITAAGVVSGTDVTVNALHGISLSGANALSGNITLNNTQSGTAVNDIVFTNVSTPINLSARNNAANGNINIKQTGALSITSLQTVANGGISIEATGAVTQTGTITTGTLTLAGTGSYELNFVNNSASTLKTTTPNPSSIEYTNNNTALTLGALQAGTITIITGSGLTQTAATIINTNNLTVTAGTSITLGEDNNAKNVSLESKASSAAQGNVTYNSNVGAANTLKITKADTLGNITITENAGVLDIDAITRGAAVNLQAERNINTKDITGLGSGHASLESINGDITVDGNITFNSPGNTANKVTLTAGGKISVSGHIFAYQLTAKAISTVTVNSVTISSNTGNEGENAAIYIEASTFAVTATAPNSIVPGGTNGQLCLILNNTWTDTYDVVDGVENVRWHQHITVNLAGMHLLYGEDDPTLVVAGTYVYVSDNNVQTTFVLEAGKHVYINKVSSNHTSGLTFETKGAGTIEFHGTNTFKKITLKTDSGGGIKFVDTDIKVTDGFELTHNEKLTLDSGDSSIEAAKITLNNIIAAGNENLSLKTTLGDININGTVGISSARVGDITLNSKDKVSILGALFANRLGVTSAGIINIGANINTIESNPATAPAYAQYYSGAVTLSSDVTFTGLAGSTVFFNSAVNGTTSARDLTVTTANVVFNGAVGSALIRNVTVNTGTAAINQNITTTGTQTYTGAVTLGGAGIRILEGTTVTLGVIDGNNHSLTITGNGVLNGGSGINALSVSGTSNIAEDITTTGNQIYTGAATLGGAGKRTISSSGNIQFHDTLTSSNEIELFAVNITISGKTTAKQLIAKAPSGTVSVNEIAISLTTYGNEGENAAIYIVADRFVVTTATPNSIVPGGRGTQWGQLCLNLQNEWTGPYDVVDGDEDEDDEAPSALTGFRWHQHFPGSAATGKILYSFYEDSTGNGILDRIRVQTNKVLNANFTDFHVTVTGYVIDIDKGVNGFQMVNVITGKTTFDNDSFYIYLKEKLELDGDSKPKWSITRNTTLMYAAGAIDEPMVNQSEMKYIDTIPPRIAYTITLPKHSETYVYISEPVSVDPSGNVSASFDGVSPVDAKSTVANHGYLFIHSNSYEASELALLPDIYNDTTSTAGNGYFQMENIIDKENEPDWNEIDSKYPPKFPLNWGYTEYAKVVDDTHVTSASGPISFTDVFVPPNKLLTVDMMTKLADDQGDQVTPDTSGPVTRRVTDVLVSMIPNAAGDNYFAWPIFAKPLGDDSSIMEFDGTSDIEKDSIEKNGIEMQVRINNNLTTVPQLFWTTKGIPANRRNPKEASDSKKIGGLWLSDELNNLTNPVLYHYVPLSSGINKEETPINISQSLFNYDIKANNLANSGAKFEFIFRFSTSDMFIARLDAKQGAIPANWYALVRPFGFNIQGIRYQRGGVTVLNNVINSDNKETAIIRSELMRSGRVTIQIYTLDGTLVKSIRRNEQREAGAYVDTWDGSNNGGRAVARGMYFVRVVGPDIDEIRKIMVVK